MELYLDSVDFAEIEAALDYGFISGLTTTPTFMHRHGITDIDGAIVKLSGMVPELQVEALGDTPDDVLKEAERILALPGLRQEPVFKVPISNAGARACNRLVSKGYRVNVHLIYTLNQAYMALAAGASFVCPLAGRLQDQGHDAIRLYEQCVEVIDRYGYDAKVMFSSVRYVEHVRQAMLAGVHVVTAPYKIIARLCDNTLTELGTAQFQEHTALMTMRVGDMIRSENPVCAADETLKDAMVRMTESRLGVVTVVDSGGAAIGVFTDGDLRRRLPEAGANILDQTIGDIGYSEDPLAVEADALLNDAVALFEKHSVDSIVVVEDGKPVGVLDIQDLVKQGILGKEHL
jgi:TalC/MipB family fructose-6-phosphate aldolase